MTRPHRLLQRAATLLHRRPAPAGFDRALTPLAIVRGDGTWVRVNDATCRLLGRERDELVGHPVAGGAPDIADATAGAPRVWELRSTWVRGDGAELRLSATGHLVGSDGDQGLYLLHLADLPPVSGRPAQVRRRTRDGAHRARGSATCHPARLARDLCPQGA